MKTETPVEAVSPMDGLECVCEGWFYKYENQWTRIMDEDGNTITTFYKRLSYEEVFAFRAGWDMGHRSGIKAGEAMKAAQIRQILGI